MRQQLSLLLLKLWTVVICDYKLRYNCDDGNFEYECPLINHWNRNQSYTFKIPNGDWCSSANSVLTKIGINLFNHNPKLPICNEEISPKVTFYSTNLNDSTKVVQMCSLDMKELPEENDNKICLSTELPRYYASNKEIWVIFIAHGFYDYGNDGKGMDPASPVFEWNSKTSTFGCLNNKSANIVQIIHTNAGILGFLEDIGHLDYYLNHGQHQPHCGQYVFRVCSHRFAYQFLIYIHQSDMDCISQNYRIGYLDILNPIEHTVLNINTNSPSCFIDKNSFLTET